MPWRVTLKDQTFLFNFPSNSTSRLTAWASPAPRLRENHLQHKISFNARVAAANQPRKRRRVEALGRRILYAK